MVSIFQKAAVAMVDKSPLVGCGWRGKRRGETCRLLRMKAKEMQIYVKFSFEPEHSCLS